MQRNDDPRNMFFNQRQEYAEGQNPQKTTQQQTPQGGQQVGGGAQGGVNNSEYEAKVRQMKELAAKYEREGEGQLVKDILNNVIEQKARGTLSNDQLIAFAKRISPLLNAEQRTRLNGLLQELLKI